jgi:hypothetical protein
MGNADCIRIAAVFKDNGATTLVSTDARVPTPT